VLDGGLGVDTLVGGLGNDTYVVDDEGDTVTELLNQGTDLVRVAIATAGGTYVLGDHVEHATLVNAVAYNLTGNALNNVLSGNAQANVLDGGLGVDTLVGGLGNDTYVVDLNANGTLQDLISEVPTTDTGDRVQLRGASTNSVVATVTLGATLEHLDASATGLSRLNLTGNASGNEIVGNEAANVLLGLGGNDTLRGGGGADILSGGVGNDVFVFEPGDSGASVGTADTVRDFALGDRIRLTNFFETGGTLQDISFASGMLSFGGSSTFSGMQIRFEGTVDGTLLINSIETPIVEQELTVGGGPVVGHVSQLGQPAVFSVNLTAGQTYTIDVLGGTSNVGDYTLDNPRLEIWSPDGLLIAIADNQSYSGPEATSVLVLDPRFSFTAGVTGSYTLKVMNGTVNPAFAEEYYSLKDNQPLAINGLASAGTFEVTVNQAPSPNDMADTLIDDARWMDTANAERGTPVTINYAFTTTGFGAESVSTTNPNFGWANFTHYTPAEKALARQWLQQWESVANINFVENDTSPSLRLAFGVSADGFSTGSAWRYDQSGTSIWSAERTVDASITQVDMFIDKVNGIESPYDFWYLFQHEMGHALGFKHPGTYGIPSYTPPVVDPLLPTALDRTDFTVMSYSMSYSLGNPAMPGLGILDVAAIQKLYGANMLAAAGDTVWEFNDTTKEYQATIWDAAGNDTIDASGQNLGSIINLHEGALSTIGTFVPPADITPQELSQFIEQGVFADRAYYNVGIAFGAKIENAKGGAGDDYLIGNGLANLLEGNSGDDVINGGDGGDILLGGSGNDVLIGAQGGDTLTGGAGADVFRFNSQLEPNQVDILADFISGQDVLELDRDIFFALHESNLLEAETFVSVVNAIAFDGNDHILYDPNNGHLSYDADGSGGSEAIHFATFANGANLSFDDIRLI